MSAELIAIVLAEAAPVGMHVTASLWTVRWLRALDRRSSDLLQRVARMKALIEGSGLFRPPEALQPAGNSSHGREGIRRYGAGQRGWT